MLDSSTIENYSSSNSILSFGNHIQKTKTVNNQTQTQNIPIADDSNKITSNSYDLSGHILSDGTRTFTYNSEGRNIPFLSRWSKSGLRKGYPLNPRARLKPLEAWRKRPQDKSTDHL